MDLSNIEDFQYSDKLKMLKITKNEIFQTIKHLRTQKARGPDQILNEEFKVIAIQLYSY